MARREQVLANLPDPDPKERDPRVIVVTSVVPANVYPTSTLGVLVKARVGFPKVASAPATVGQDLVVQVALVQEVPAELAPAVFRVPAAAPCLVRRKTGSR